MNLKKKNLKNLNTPEINLCINLAKKIYFAAALICAPLFLWICILYIMIRTLSLDDSAGILQTLLFTLKTLYLLLLPVPELLYFLVAGIIKRRKKSKPRTLLPKTENRHLTGFYPPAALTPPPTIFLTLPGICLFFFGKNYLIAAALILWLFLQLMEGKQMSKDRESEKKKQLRKDVLELYQTEKNTIAKSLHYAVIMEDDSGLIPSSFGNGNYPVTDILLFDHTTEIKPFLAEDPENNYAQNWGSLYMCPDFFIYAFDSAKYSMEELEQKCINAITFSRFPLSKPLYILILGFSSQLSGLLRKYAWLPEVSIQVLDLWDRLQIQDIINDYIDKKHIPWYKSQEEDQAYGENPGSLTDKIYTAAALEYMPALKTSALSWMIHGRDTLKYNCWNYMSFYGSCLKLPLEQAGDIDRDYFYHYMNSLTTQIFYTLQNGALTFYHSVSNLYVCGFFPNIFRWKEISIGVMAEFEYAHLALRFVHYYLFSKHAPGPIEEYFREDKDLGAAIFELTQPEDMLYAPLHQEMDLSDPLLHNALLILKELFGIQHTQETLDFPHLFNILRIARNITRGHGAIRQGMQDQLWFALYVLLNLLSEMLCIGSMQIEPDKELVKISYTADEDWYWASQYAIMQEHVPMLLHRISKKNRFEYINYYKGNAAVPEIIEFPKAAETER